MTDVVRPQIWTRAYTALCGAVFLDYLNQASLRPLLPVYVVFLGGTEASAGVALFCFSFISFAIRPQLGRLIDATDSTLILICGSVALSVLTFGMAFGGLVAVLIVFTLRGAGWAAINASSSAAVAHLAPPSRRGEASGYYALFPAVANTVGPGLALYWVAQTDDFVVVFVAAGLCSGLAACSCLLIRPRNAPRRPPRIQRGSPRFVAHSVMLPAAILAMLTVSQPAMLGFFPLYAREIQLDARAVTTFYVLSGLSSLVGRALLGRVSDRTSRGLAILVGFLIVGLSFVAILQTGHPRLVVLAGGLYSLGHGMVSPATMALAMDRAGDHEVGHAMASYSAAYQLGMGTGGLWAGVTGGWLGYAALYQLTGLIVLGGVALTVSLWPRLSPRRC